MIFETKSKSSAVILLPEFRALKSDGVWAPLPTPFFVDELIEREFLTVKDSTRAASLLTEAKSALADNPAASTWPV